MSPHISKMLSFQYIINIKVIEIFYTLLFFWYQVFKSWCVLCIYSISQFRLPTFKYPVATCGCNYSLYLELTAAFRPSSKTLTSTNSIMM